MRVRARGQLFRAIDVIERARSYQRVQQLGYLHLQYRDHFPQLWCRQEHQNHDSKMPKSHLPAHLHSSDHEQREYAPQEQVLGFLQQRDRLIPLDCEDRKSARHAIARDGSLP